MTDARLRLFWHRAGPMTAFAALAAVAAAQGCGGGSETTTSTTGTGGKTSTSSSSTSMSTSTMSTSSSMGTGGTGGMMPTALTPSLAADAIIPFDATPDPTGATLYFTGLSTTGKPLAGVYSAPSNGSTMTPAAVTAGAPYVAPYGIATSTDGMTLYVADPGADITLDANGNQIGGGACPKFLTCSATGTTGTDNGVIFKQATTGGAPTPIMGTAGYQPRNLEINSESNADFIYFTGVDPTGTKPGVFKVAAAGGTVSTIAEGAPFVDPSGIAIGSDGTIYVADTAGAAGGQIISIPKGTTTPGTAASFLPGLRLGYPAGVAVSMDGKSLLISSLDPVKATDVILQVTIATPTATPTQITTNILTNYEAAGLHRAKTAEVFAFADGGSLPASGTTPISVPGGVYTVK